MRKAIVTTSWDDNHPKNLDLVKLLNQYQSKGTFYLDGKAADSKVITELARVQEIGAHSLTHPDLTKISLKQARKEILGSKKWLEQVIGQPIKMLAYPFGHYNSQIKEIAGQAGFIGARTTKEFCLEKSQDPFEFNPTLQIYPFPLRKRNAKTYHSSRYLFQPLAGKFFQVLKLGLPLKSFSSWLNLACSLFDHVLKNNGVFHLWGHSFELEKYNLWQDLEEIFKYIAQKEKVFYWTNGQVLESL